MICPPEHHHCPPPRRRDPYFATPQPLLRDAIAPAPQPLCLCLHSVMLLLRAHLASGNKLAKQRSQEVIAYRLSGASPLLGPKRPKLNNTANNNNGAPSSSFDSPDLEPQYSATSVASVSYGHQGTGINPARSLGAVIIYNRDATWDDHVRLMHEAGYDIRNLDATLILQRPKLSPYKDAIKANLSTLLGVDLSVVNIKAKTHEKVDSLGENRSITAHIVVLLMRK